MVLGQIFEGVLYFFIGFLWIRLVTGWVLMFARSWEPAGPLLVLLEGTFTVTDPPIQGLRRVLKPIRIGNFILDLSFILVMITAYILLFVNRSTLL